MTASALHQLLSPDGYYTYLNIPKKTVVPGSKEKDVVDAELVKKNYRRMSLKHHPDRPTGDPETFRVLTRAKRVLTTPTLRKTYDLLGLDLEEDDETNDHQETHTATTEPDDSKKKKDDEHDNTANHSSNNDESHHGNIPAESVLSTLASVTLASILQAAVRTAMMALASTLICRYKVLMIPGILFLCYVSFRVFSVVGKEAGWYEKLAPICISAGLYTMHTSESGDWIFWCGETMVMTCFFLNSILPTTGTIHSNAMMIGSLLASMILAWLLRGKFWRYLIILSIEGVLAIIAVLVFPIMEMIFEEIMNEKLRKIGEKIRIQFKRVHDLQKQHNNQVSPSID